MEMLKGYDPSFLVLAGITLTVIFFSMGIRIYGAIAFYRRLRSYMNKLPCGDPIPSSSLCELLGIDGERLRELTGKQMVSRHDAEKLIRRMISQDWWE